MNRHLRREGYTLIELMLVVLIVTVLAGIAIPKIGETMRRAQESRTKGNLATLRASLTVHLANAGTYPLELEDVVKGPFATLREIPYKNTPPYHWEGNTVTNGPAMGVAGATGSWFYFNDPNGMEFGSVVVNCVHRDMRGRIWSSL